MEEKFLYDGLILLIVYDRLQASAFTDKLKGYGYDHIEVCTDGKTALEKLNKIEPDVVLLDVELKGEINGIDTGKRIRQQYNLPLIYMSGLQDENTFRKARNTRPLAFLNKPVNWNELRMAIESAFQWNIEKNNVDSLLKNYLQMFKEAPLPCFTLDAEGNFVSVNQAWSELTGYFRKEVEGEWFGSLLAPEDKDRFRNDFAAFIQKGSILNTRYEMIGKDGNSVCISVDGKVRYDEKGHYIKSHWMLKDTTAEKLAGDKLIESEEKFRNLIESAGDIIYILDHDLNYLYGNNNCLKRYDLTMEELTGMHYRHNHSSESNKELIKKVGEVQKSGEPVIYEHQSMTDDKYFLRTLSPILDPATKRIESIAVISRDITGLKDTEKALLKRENEIRTITDHIPALVSYVDADSRYRFVNKQYEEWFGISSGRIIGKHIWEVLGKNAYEQIRTRIDKVLSGKRVIFNEEVSYARGGIRWISAEYIPDIDENGMVSGFFALVTDITESKKIERKLQESEERYRQIFQHYPIGIAITGQDKKFISVNPAYCKMMGYSEEELRHMSYLDFTHPDHYDENIRGIDKLWKGEIGEYRTEKRFITRNGNVRWGNLIVTIVKGQDGNALYALAMVEDSTERRQAQVALQTSEARFKAFMDNLPVMTYIKDKEGNYIYGNKAILKFAGKPLNQFRDTRVSDYIPADLAKWMNQMDKKVLIAGKTVELDEWRYVTGNIERWYTEYKFPISISGEEKLIGGWMMDITRRKIAESALKESEKLYKDLVEKAGIAIITDDVDGNITFFNREFARLFGYTMAEMKNQSRENLVNKDDLKKMNIYHKRRMSGDKAPENYEVRGIRKNGDEIWIEVKTTVLEDDKKITGTRNYLWDMTEREKIQETVENSETRFRELFNNMSSGVAVYEYDPGKEDFVFKDINRSGMLITRIKRKGDVVGKCLLECFPGVKELGLWDVLFRVNETGSAEKTSDTRYLDDRIDLYVENFVYKLNTGELVAVFDDIGESVLAEQSLLRSYSEIRKLSQHLENIREEERKYIAGELHDELGQILTAIKMDVSWIRNKLPRERKGIKKRAGSAIQIIDEAISKVQHLSMELRPRMLDDLGLLETLKAYFREYERWGKTKIHYELPQQEPEMIPGQEITVFRLIQESLTNIARHARASEVDVIVKAGKKMFELKIHDNGIGIPDDKIESSESYGILNMKERIGRWEGKFEIKGKEGAGTTINVSLPTHQT